MYDKVVLMMGNFHTICNFMSSIGKMLGEAGRRDIAVESGVIAEGSINNVLEGKQYYHAVQLGRDFKSGWNLIILKVYANY